jgi:hypothetical protein
MRFAGVRIYLDNVIRRNQFGDPDISARIIILFIKINCMWIEVT